MDKKITAELLKKYAEGKCTPDETQLIESWLKAEEKFVQENLPEDEDPILGEEIWTSVAPAPRVLKLTWQIAAAAILLLGTFIIGYQVKFRTGTQPAFTTKTITAPKGSVKILHLPDSSIVWLQGGAAISFTEPFGQITRDITLLHGKAQFDVSHNPSKPFIVHSGTSRVEVLGTRFIVSQDSLATQVTLTRGKIRFRDRLDRTQILSPGEQLIFHKRKDEMVLSQIDTSNVSAWTRQSLLFKNVPLTKVLKEIEEVYGISCRPGSNVDGSRLLNAQFDQMPLDDVLRLLENSTGYRFHAQNGIVHID